MSRMGQVGGRGGGTTEAVETVERTRRETSGGRFTKLAGPVTVHALNRCVRASGSIAGTAASTGWILC